MPIDKNRAARFLDLLTQDRKIQKMMQKTPEGGLKPLFTDLNKYLMPSGMKADGSDPETDVQKLLNVVNKLQPIIEKLEAVKNDPGDGVMSREDEQELRAQMTDLFSGEPKPENAVTNYLNTYGEKHLASAEIQFASALISAARGMYDAMENELVSEAIEAKSAENAQIHANYAALGNKNKTAVGRAVELGVKLEPQLMENAIAEYKAQQQTLKEQAEALGEALLEEGKKSDDLARKAQYEILEGRVNRAENSLRLSQEHLSKAEQNSTLADQYYAENATRLNEQYPALNKQLKGLKEKREKTLEKFRKGARDRNFTLKEEKNSLAAWNRTPEIMSKLNELERTEPLVHNYRAALENIRTLFSSPDSVKSLAEAASKSSLDINADSLDREWIEKNGSNLQKYLLLKEQLLEGFRNPTRTTIAKQFKAMEQSGFTAESFAPLDEALQNNVQPLAQRLDRLKRHEDVVGYFALKASIEKIEKEAKAEQDVVSAIDKEINAVKSQIEGIENDHAEVCRQLCSNVGWNIGNRSMISKWPEFHADVKKKVRSSKKSVEISVSGLKHEKKRVEEEKQSLAEGGSIWRSRSPEEDRMRAEIKDLVKQQNEMDRKIITTQSAADEYTSAKTRTVSAFEHDKRFCKNLVENIDKPFASERISQRLDELYSTLSAPRKRGNDSEEFRELKETLEDARKVFAGKEEGRRNRSPIEQKNREKEILTRLSEKANHYLTEKEKEPHIWPFASATGFKRRAAANEIFGFCRAAEDIINRAPDAEYEIANRIAAQKNPDGSWNDHYAEQQAEPILSSFVQKVNEGIANKPTEIQAENRQREEPRLSNKPQNPVLGFR